MKRFKHNLGAWRLFSYNLGELIPVGKPLEIIPGDTLVWSDSVHAKWSPLIYPCLTPVTTRIHRFFVSHDQVWPDFTDWITGGEDGANANTFPTITFGSAVSNGDLADYLGVPKGVAGLQVSALPFRGVSHIWNNMYRDQDLQTARVIDKTDGADSTTDTTLPKISWEKDYFTSARDTEQKGDEVSIPLGDVTSDNTTPTMNSASLTGAKLQADEDGDGKRMVHDGSFSGSAEDIKWNNSGLQVEATSISDLREAFALQRFREQRQYWGARYPEYLRRAFGVVPSNRSLQLPQYLGGGKVYNTFAPHYQSGVTTSGTSKTGVGDYAGIGQCNLKTRRHKHFFNDFGYVYTFISSRPKTLYSQGIPKDYLYSAKEDFFIKELQHIGQEAILNKQLYAGHSSPGGTFGYQNRYDHLRRSYGSVHGDFADASTNMDHMHLGRLFSSDPALNSAFVTCTPSSRIFQSTATDQIQCVVKQDQLAKRLVSPVGDPR